MYVTIGSTKCSGAIDRDTLHFEPYTEPHPVNEIIVTDPLGREYRWRDQELRLRLAADDLLIAAKNVLAAEKIRRPLFGWNPQMRTTFRHLQETVDAAERGQA